MTIKKTYHPIDCDLYDQLEIFAMHNTKVDIIFNDNDTHSSIEDIIITIESINSEEFLILKSGFKIRLDALIQVGNIAFESKHS